MQLVLDASVAVKWYAPEDYTLESLQVADAARRGHIALLAPDILVSEFGHSLRKAVRVGLPSEIARSLFSALRRSSQFVPSVALADEALELAMATGGSFYDALYVALAQREDANVVTADGRMINSFQALGRCVHVKDLRL